MAGAEEATEKKDRRTNGSKLSWEQVETELNKSEGYNLKSPFTWISHALGKMQAKFRINTDYLPDFTVL